VAVYSRGTVYQVQLGWEWQYTAGALYIRCSGAESGSIQQGHCISGAVGLTVAVYSTGTAYQVQWGWEWQYTAGTVGLIWTIHSRHSGVVSIQYNKSEQKVKYHTVASYISRSLSSLIWRIESNIYKDTATATSCTEYGRFPQFATHAILKKLKKWNPTIRFSKRARFLSAVRRRWR
jgi:hypothetical protein